MKPCVKCGACDRYPCGRCKACAVARSARYKVAPPQTRAVRAKRVAALLRESPMSRLELQRRLGITQQRASEALSDIGAQIIGHEPRDIRGRPMPIYGLDTPRQQSRIGAVSSVWQLGSMA